MAEISSGDNSHKKRKGIKRMKKQSTRIDLTPLVDLGFLLITFFIFTATMSQPKVMKAILPDNKGESMPTKESGALTLLPGSNSIIYYYEGKFDKASPPMSANLRQIRQVIINKKSGTNPKDLFIIIKPSKESVYKDVVNLLNEMLISDIKSYALVDITPEEDAVVK